MKLSVIIVNYNVTYFLEQCLHSVEKAVANLEGEFGPDAAEVFVVDNNSVDGSCVMVRKKFPSVKLIENKTNTGFSVANNQAMRLSKAEYSLLLNPDTIVEEDTFTKTVRYMDGNRNVGGLGVKMIDGKGNFLPESKRGLPTPLVAFYKIFGLSKIFPKSKTFGQYHLGHLDKNQIHEVEILAGAFMLLRKSVLDEIGLLDETFFMYGEDIDLSYRIVKAGYKNIYYPNTTIIHYKGESTKKGSINYVLVFYNAMIIFARKHFSNKNARLFSSLINIAIYFRAGLSILKRFFMAILLPLLDFISFFIGYLVLTPRWEQYIFPDGGNYPSMFLHFVVPVYILIWIGTMLFTGAYDKPVKIWSTVKGIVGGTVIILMVYALLNEDFRFSRALILMGAGWAVFCSTILRYILHYLGIAGIKLDTKVRKKMVIIGQKEETERVKELLKQTDLKSELVGLVSTGESVKQGEYIGDLLQLKEVVNINRVDEIIFCSKDIPSGTIIQNMLALSEVDVDYKIAPPESLSIIGSNSIDTAGDLYVVNINSIAKPSNIRNKRILDISVALFLFALSPILLFFVRKKTGFFRNIFLVLFGSLSWVGYFQSADVHTLNLPKIRKGVLNPSDRFGRQTQKSASLNRLNMIYAKDYKVANDFFIIFKGLKKLGNSG